MSLLGSIRMAANTLQANQIAMQVVGQNIANANTPGYIREEVILSPAPTQRVGGLLLGMGVEVSAVVQKIDKFLEERLRASVSDRASSEAQEQTYLQLEGLIGELGDTDLSTSLNDFFSSISEILNDPGSVSARNLAVLQGITLTDAVKRLARQVVGLRTDVNGRIDDMTARINELIEEIRVLNVRIAETEGGDVSGSDAVGLRDQRLAAMENLAQLISIRVQEQPSGGVAIYCGGDFIVYEGTSRPVELVLNTDRGLMVADVQLAETKSPLNTSGGQLRGLLTARDDILGGFQDRLGEFAEALVFEFNKVYSSGQGLTGFEALTSEFSVDAGDVPLDGAGLKFTPVNGSFQLLVYNKKTGLKQTTDILVDLNGLGQDTTLDGLVAAMDAVDGVSVVATPTGKLAISTDSPDHEFAFADDTSGILAALGLNTFFSGSTAGDIGVNPMLTTDAEAAARFAASRGGIGVDTQNAVDLANFLDRQLESHNGASMSVLYDRLIGVTVQGSTAAQAVAEGSRVFEQTLRGQKMATSGVSLDEETVRLIGYQHSFQASARYIEVLEELFGILVNI